MSQPDDMGILSASFTVMRLGMHARRSNLASALRRHQRLAPQPARRLSISEWLNIAQFLALIIGGIWTLMVFTKFDAKDRELGQQKSSLELQKLGAKPVSLQQDILIWRRAQRTANGPGNLVSEYSYTIENASNQKIRIVQIELHAYLLAEQSLGTTVVSEIPPPALSSSSPWTSVLFKTYLSDGESLNTRPGQGAMSPQAKPIVGGGGTGDMEPGEVHWGGLTLLVKPQAYSFIGFSADALVRFPNNALRWIGVGQGTKLEPGEYPGSSDRRMSMLDHR